MDPGNTLIDRVRALLAEDEVFLVGGAVRDLLENREVKDYDFLMEGDAFLFARRLADKLNCSLVLNRKLLTATLDTQWGTVDIARARREVYEYPGALPKVYPAAWWEDLHRRDFTINTLALPLLKEGGWGEMVDLLGGYSDLQAKLIRVLHQDSFRDDPTRMLRALRLKNRLGYALEEKTRAWLQRDWEYMSCLSPARRLKEWVLLCDEPDVPAILHDLYYLGGWHHFLGNIPYRAGVIDGLADLCVPPEKGKEKDNEKIRDTAKDKIRNNKKEKEEDKEKVEEQDTERSHEKDRQEDKGKDSVKGWYLYLLAMLAVSPASLPVLAAYWGLSQKDRLGLEATLEMARDWDSIKLMKKRQLYRLLGRLPREGVYYLFRQGIPWDYSWEEFYREILFSRMPLTGQDLLRLGLEPGPQLGGLLERLENCYREEAFDSKEEGIRLAVGLIKEESDLDFDRSSD